MGRKTEAAARMRAMEVELDELFERCKYLTSRIEKLEHPPLVRKPSLVEQAKRRVVELGDRVMGAVGL